MSEFYDLIADDPRYLEFYKSLHSNSKSYVKKVIQRIHDQGNLVNKFKKVSIKDSYKSSTGKTYQLPTSYERIATLIELIDKKKHKDFKEYLIKAKSYDSNDLLKIESINSFLYFGDKFVEKSKLRNYKQIKLGNQEYLLIHIKNHKTLTMLSSKTNWCVRYPSYWEAYTLNYKNPNFYLLYNLKTKKRYLLYTRMVYGFLEKIIEFKNECNYNVNSINTKKLLELVDKA